MLAGCSSGICKACIFLFSFSAVMRNCTNVLGKDIPKAMLSMIFSSRMLFLSCSKYICSLMLAFRKNAANRHPSNCPFSFTKS